MVAKITILILSLLNFHIELLQFVLQICFAAYVKEYILYISQFYVVLYVLAGSDFSISLHVVMCGWLSKTELIFIVYCLLYHH